MHVDEIYEYSYVTMYHRNELHVAPTIYSKYETFFRGYYKPASDSGKNDDVYVLGCKTYQTWGSTGNWPHAATKTYVTSSWPTDVVYGLCMKGWINTFEVWKASGNWDTIFNADTDTRA